LGHRRARLRIRARTSTARNVSKIHYAGLGFMGLARAARAHDSCDGGRVRLLVVIRGSIRLEAVKTQWQAACEEACELAFCYVLPAGRDGFLDAVRAQRAVTTALRQTCGAEAEKVAVFAACERDGERVEDCASAWGATEVSDKDKPNRPAPD
jgi:hypothetical protein